MLTANSIRRMYAPIEGEEERKRGVNLMYSRDFRIKAVAMCEKRKTVDVAKELGVKKATLYSWLLKKRRGTL